MSRSPSVAEMRAQDGRPQFADLQRELIGDLMPRSEEFAPGSHSLGARYLRRNTLMMFNLGRICPDADGRFSLQRRSDRDRRNFTHRPISPDCAKRL